MKYFLLIILMLVTVLVFAQNEPVVNFNIGNIGLGGNFPLRNDFNLETSLSLANFGFEGRQTNLGIEFSPLMLFGWSNDSEESAEMNDVSLLNLKMYWNALTLGDSFLGNFYMGPFASVNYFFVDDLVRWNRYILTTGIHLGFKANLGRVYYNIISFEMGFRDITGTHRYFIGMRMDIGALILLVLFSNLSNNTE